MPPEREGPRVNQQISVSQVRLIDDEGTNVGIVGIDDALDRADNVGLDLVEISPDADPPVCKLLDYGKYKYELSKKAKPQKTAKLKTIKLRPKTDGHDLKTKLNQARKFLGDGDRVRFVMRLRGREAAYKDRWCTLLRNELEELLDAATISLMPQAEGRAVVAQMDPK